MTPFCSGYGQALQITATTNAQLVRLQGQSSWMRIRVAGSINLYFTADDAANSANGYPLSAQTIDMPLKARELWISGSGQVNILALIAG